MSKKKKQRPTKPMRPTKPACLEGLWHFDPDVPTYDLFENLNPVEHEDLGEVLHQVVFWIEKGYFLRWEAIVCDELGLPLTARQEEALGELLSFSDDPDDDRILYIDEIPRPDVLWYEIVRKFASNLLKEPYKTAGSHFDVTYEGWKDLVAALEKHGDGLSLPRGVDRPIEVVPAGLRHKLWLQMCFDQLSGLGQEDELTLRNEEQQDRIKWFVRDLRGHKESVEFLDLTLESLLKVLILPPQDGPIFIEMMKKELGLNSTQDKIAERLS
jgi:hypothetical protein